ncbi:sodium:solute symporter [Christiangramia sediminis]|uniref:Sodium:solute symporter n=1 Tax=Christiangramia sediminis TaxID=2881336 RepID=A0A9X1LI47_9FLAO|nr:sodium:solute symporter [Christiangramia sediminis]MCB7480820.1 sodium:solute symporter [Christiangramia sediminis]
MQPYQVLILIAAYFAVLILISYFTGRGGSNAEFFKANKQAPWYLVAFGMIGASLSGVTFISIPGTVETDSFSYFQVVLGYTIGYVVIGQVLLPLYYKMNLTSIYTYLESRFGNASYKTGASFFLLSRVVGASFRLFLVANVLQLVVFDAMGVPYYVTVTITILLIWLYTFKSGIKTIIWTDTLQTFFMLLALGITIYFISEDLGFSLSNLFGYLAESEHSQIFFFEDWKSKDHFIKQFLSGAFIAIVMTGLDQDMMQKNLTCRSLKDAQKNMFWFTIVLVFVNFLFLALGVLLTDYADVNGITEVRDDLFPAIATSGELGMAVAIFFILGLIAAAYSSADSALTALTTSFSIDILDIEKKYDEKKQVRIRKQIHVAISILLILVMLAFKYAIADKSVINKLFQFAGYTYGPLLGLYTFGLFTKWQVRDKLVPVIAVAAPVLSYIISINSLKWVGFEFGFFILILNGLLTFLGLVLLRRKHH